MIRITIEVEPLEQVPDATDPGDEAAVTLLREHAQQVADRVTVGETSGILEDYDGAPVARFRVEEGLAG